MTVTPADRELILRFVRDAIGEHLRGEHPADPLATGVLAQHAGAFVSIHVAGELRGCIGHPDSNQPVAKILTRCAIAAASEDPRFPPLTQAELSRAAIEVSLLGPIEPVADLSEIEIGRHGLIVEQGHRRGLLLPQVATERGWSRDTFLSQTCVKAGLSPTAWRDRARLFKFEAEVFGDEATSG